ncbi:MAG TPA: hypothetical protein VIJ40_08460 [Acidimicrobiales bacterium]
MDSPSELSRAYIEGHISYDLNELMAWEDEFIDFKRAEDEPLSGAEAVHHQYKEDCRKMIKSSAL